MADPFFGASNSITSNTMFAGGPGGDPTTNTSPTSPGPAAGTDNTSWLTNLTSGLSDLSSGVSSFFNSPAGSLAEFGTLAGLGLSQASDAKKTNDALAGSLSSLGTPFTGTGQGINTQLKGGTPVAGPLGASITDQTTAAANFGNVAKAYSTGQLTAAQQQQVNDFVKQQRAMVDSQLAASGNTDGSARDAAYQQIDNNAAELGQQLISSDLGVGRDALNTVQQTYSTLLNQALSTAQFGFGAQEAAVQTQIQSDTQLAQSLNQLFGAIAQGFGTAMGAPKVANVTPGGTTTGTATSPASQAANQLAKGAGSALQNAATGGATAPAAGPGTGLATSTPSDILNTDLSNFGSTFGGISTAAPAANLAETDLSSFGSVFGTPTAATDVTAATGVTPAFNTGFMSSGASGVAGAANLADTQAAQAAAGGASAAAPAVAPAAAAPALAPAAAPAAAAPAVAAPAEAIAPAAAVAPALTDVGIMPIGTGAIDEIAAQQSAEAASALGSSSSSAALGPLAGTLAGIGLTLAPALLGMSTPAFSDSAEHWANISKALKGGYKTDPNTVNHAYANDPQSTLFADTIMGVLSQPANQVPNDIKQLVWQTGLVPPGQWGLPTGDPKTQLALLQQANTAGRGTRTDRGTGKN